MSIVVIVVGFLLDMILGDPLGFIHPVRGIGFIITTYEKVFFRKNGVMDAIKGSFLVVVVLLIVLAATKEIIFYSALILPELGLVVECLLAWSVLAAKGLKKESMKVYDALADFDENPDDARQALSMIVGRDTSKLNKEKIIKATVETVAENTSDGEIAPLFYLAVGGPVLAMCYKAINTMDSMVGYKNNKYLYFGRAAARLDDMAGFIPSRLSAFASIIAAGILRLDAKNAFRIFRRDRYKTASPNAGQTESVFAGALGIALGGDSVYFGKTVRKPRLGDNSREIVAEDIITANRLMYVCSYLCLVVFVAVRIGILYLLGMAF